MPTPDCENESREEWMDRCMSSDEAQEDFPDQDQRLAFCGDAWDEECGSSVDEEFVESELEELRQTAEEVSQAMEDADDEMDVLNGQMSELDDAIDELLEKMSEED